MSDHDGAADPMDKAYAQAEAMLSDDDARAARRARVLGAVAAEAGAAAPAAAAPAEPRRRWPHGRWLIAAGVAGFSLLIAQVYEPSRFRPPPATAPREPAVTADQAAPPPMQSPPPESRLGPSAPAASPRTESRSVAGGPAAAPPPPPPSPPPPMSAAPPPPAPVAAPMRGGETADAAMVRNQSQSPPALARAPAAESMAVGSASPTAQAARLHAAAAAGRVRDVAAALADGAAIDAQDGEGETALMKAVRANHPGVASFLRRRGADLDLKNRAGESARDIAASARDDELDRALGIAR